MDKQKPEARSQVYRRPSYFIDGFSQVNRPKPYQPISRPTPTNPTRRLETASFADQTKAYPPKVERPQALIGTLPHAGHLVTQKPPRRYRPWPKRALKPVMIMAVVLLIGFGAWLAASVLGSIDKVFHGNLFSDAYVLIKSSPLKQSNGRINILLTGDSINDPQNIRPALAESIMVLSYNPKNQSGFILSIPRDLWVYIPKIGYRKIDTANDIYTFREPGLPSGGMGQLQQIVQNELGIPIDYEVLFNYAALKDAINTASGITIDIKSPNPSGVYDSYTRLRLPNGWDKLDGQEALDLVRAHGDNVSSGNPYGVLNNAFNRMQYQRQVLIMLLKKALTIRVLSDPIKMVNLFDSFGNNVQTDLTLSAVVSLLKLSGGLSLSHLKPATYSYGTIDALLTNYKSPNGQEVLVPALGIHNFTAIKEFYGQLTSK
jgi:LCP family protein required for cell wall assembly